MKAAGPAMMRRLCQPVWLFPLLLLSACSPSSTSFSGVTPSTLATSPAATVLPSTPVALSAGNFTCSSKSGGLDIPAAAAAHLTAVRVAHHPGYDRLTFEFAGSTLPHYTVSTKPDTLFSGDASGRPLRLQGAAGLLVIFSPAAATDPGSTPPYSYSGPTDLAPQLPVLLETRQTGDFEHVLSWGVGLANPACFAVQTLVSPVRLVIDVAAPSP